MLEKESNYYMKFITCSSINEKEIRNPIYNTIFKKENYNFEIITRLIDKNYKHFDKNKTKTFSLFGKLPMYYLRISNSKNNNLINITNEI